MEITGTDNLTKFLKNNQKNRRLLLKTALLTVFAFVAVNSVRIFQNLKSKATEAPFCFAHISDVHVGGTGNPVENFTSAVDKFNRMTGLFFVVNTGDIADTAAENEFRAYKEITNLSQKNINTISGNHDNPNLSVFESIIGPKNFNFVYQTYRFIGLNTMAIDFGWLDGQLTAASSAGQKIVVFGHLPVTANRNHTWVNLSEENKTALKSRFQQYQILAYLSGHLHESYRIDEQDIAYIGTPNLNSGSYQWICLNGRQISNLPIAFSETPPGVTLGQPEPTATQNPGSPTLTVTPSLTLTPVPGTPTATRTPTPTSTPSTSNTIYFKADFLGFSSEDVGISVTIKVKDNDFSKALVLSDDGKSEAVSLEGLEVGENYDFLLSSTGFLTGKKSLTLKAGRNPASGYLDFGTIGTGDLKNDNQINGLDWSLMKSNYGESGEE